MTYRSSARRGEREPGRRSGTSARRRTKQQHKEFFYCRCGDNRNGQKLTDDFVKRILLSRALACPLLARRLRLLSARAQICSNAKQTNILISLRIYSPRDAIVDAQKVLKILSSIPVSRAFFHPIRATTESSFVCRSRAVSLERSFYATSRRETCRVSFAS